MEIPFEIGSRYRNRKGEYEVLSIEADQMSMRYDDGSIQQVGADLQAKIWRNIRDEDSTPLPSKSTPGQRGEKGQVTAPIRELVDDVLRAHFKAPFPKDITDQVCLAIEADQVLVDRYWSLVEHFSSGGKDGHSTVNNWIGTYTKELTGMMKVEPSAKAQSSLIKTYSQLMPADSPRKGY